MDNPRPEKVAVVDEVRGRFERASAAILTEYRGLTVKDLATLRRSLREAGGEYRIYKNTLVRFAAHDLGLDGIDSLLVGPTAIAFVDGDAVNVAKALRDYGRTNVHLVVKGGVLGTTIMSAADTTALADLPPRDILLSRLAGALAAPLQQFAGLLQALPRNFAYGLKALIEKAGGDAALAPAAESAPDEDQPPAAEVPAVEDPAVAESSVAEAPPAEAPAVVEEPAVAESPPAEAP
ncbi:MAG TPA: 50S ribosomal protein L10, partial [Acidimicrobiales bacterium]|nr:50S ribosomal protein L10 [Acidimicrobiales bacterium]